MKRNTDAVTALIGKIVVVVTILAAGFLGSLIYILVHFLRKVW